MKSRQSIRMTQVFTDRYPLVGPAFWVLSIQYYLAQVFAALDWAMPFSLTHNTISDLGNTACGAHGYSLVCSPLHSLMNASFMLLGITMIAGSVLIYQVYRGKLSIFLAFICMTLAGFGTILVGLFPENTISSFHIIGAALPFVLGNIALIVFSLALPLPKAFRVLTFLGGLLALIALGLLLTNNYMGLGQGGMERLTAYPQSIWMIAFGLYMSYRHLKTRLPK